MYQNLMFGIKRRIISEVEDAFLNHPAFSEKVKVYNKFPYEQRVQFGAILRGTYASQIRMSADNYLADLHSHVRLARVENYPGIGIEWVRENTNDITKYIVDEDLSSQADPTQRLLFTTQKIVAGSGTTRYADSPTMVSVTINGLHAPVQSVDGEKKQIILAIPAPAGSTVKVSYWYRAMVAPGLYYVDFTEDNELFVDVLYIINDEVLIEDITGLEVSATTQFQNIAVGSEKIDLKTHGFHHNCGLDTGADILLVKDVDYTIDYPSGTITFLKPLPTGFQMLISYRYSDGNSFGPFTFKTYQEIHNIGGVTMCIGRRAKKGDKQVVIVTDHRESQASIYGGHWDMSLSLGVIAKDAIQMEEMTDQVVNWLWSVRKNVLEFEGITLNRVEPTGESEESFIDTTGDLYYESSVDISVMTEWQRFVPHLFSIRHISATLVGIAPDVRPVFKHPAIGYERVL